MARLVAIKPTLKKKPLILAIVIGIIFISFAVSGVETSPPTPLYLRAVIFSAGSVAIFLGIWRLTHDSKLYRSVSRLNNEIKVENERIIFPKELKLKPGTLKCWRSSGEIPYGHVFEESGDTVRLRVLGIDDFKGKLSVFAGFDSSIAVGSGKLEWIEFPAYEIADEEYRVRGYSIYLAALPPAKQSIAVSKSTLLVTNGEDVGKAEIKSGEVLEGVLSFQKKGKARGVRLEFTFRTSTISCKSVISRIDSGATHFSFKTIPDEAVFILTSDLSLSTTVIIKELGFKPIMTEDVWNVGEAKIKLVLDMPRAADITDETRVLVN